MGQALPDQIPRSASRILGSLVPLVLAAFVVKAAMAFFTYGSTDVLIYEADVTKLRRDGGAALYRDGIQTEWCGHPDQRPCPPFNHPPFMIRALEGWASLAEISGLPLRFWLRMTCAVADVGSLVLLARLLRRRWNEAQARVALLWFAASPIAILVSGFHGNTDPILVFFVLLTIVLIEEGRPAWLAGVALGMAMDVKVLPVLLLPAVLLALDGSRRRIEFGVGAAATFLVGSMPLLLEAPALVVTRVFGYRSQSGSWGLSLLALLLGQTPHLAWLGETYARHGTLLSLGLVLGASLWRRPLYRADALFTRAGLVMCLFVSVIPGFGVQYLVWLVPWAVGLGSGPTAAYYIAGTGFLFGYYSATAGAFPWYLANSLERSAWSAKVLGLGLICWVVVCVMAFMHARRLAGWGGASSRAT